MTSLLIIFLALALLIGMFGVWGAIGVIFLAILGYSAWAVFTGREL